MLHNKANLLIIVSLISICTVLPAADSSRTLTGRQDVQPHQAASPHTPQAGAATVNGNGAARSRSRALLKLKSLRILAFGDSLTEGWINTKQDKRPYTWRLQSLLAQQLGSSWSVQITNAGNCVLYQGQRLSKS